MTAALTALLCLLSTSSSSSSSSSSEVGRQNFENKVSIMKTEDSINPKCFTEGRKNFTCFWEEEEETAAPLDQYLFTYTYQNEASVQCPLQSGPSPGGGTLFVCRLDQVQMFIPVDLEVRRHGDLIHNRSLFVELVFLLDPPSNVSLTRTETPGQLTVSWVAPALKYMEDSMLFQVRYQAAAAAAAAQVEESWSGSHLVLTNLRPSTWYQVQVRVKLDGVSYNGYWSAWSQAVAMETAPAEFDPLILCLTLIISFILLVLSLTVLLSHRRFLTKKIWPVVPSPENKFQGLFSVYGGDFQEWLGHTNGGLWVAADQLFSEERASPLEVISEFSLGPPPVVERSASTLTPDPWLMDRVLQQTSLPESQDPYVTLSNPPEGGPLEERLPVGGSHSDLGGSGLSSRSSLEDPPQAWAHHGPAYTYMAVADSGVSMDYSPMSRGGPGVRVPAAAHEYKNDVVAQKRRLQRQHAVHQVD